MSPPIAYLDASAAVKLVIAEPQSAHLLTELREIRSWVSSEILEVELMCVARRARLPDGLARGDQLLARIDVIAFSPDVRARATSEWTPPQRALDAIHLATAATLPTGDVALYTYDRDQAAAGRGAGLEVRSPGA